MNIDPLHPLGTSVTRSADDSGTPMAFKTFRQTPGDRLQARFGRIREVSDTRREAKEPWIRVAAK